jgi:dUTP pyrophosphatase
MSDLKVFRMFDDVTLPIFGSTGSACFDLCAYIDASHGIRAWTDAGSKEIPKQIRDPERRVIMYPNERIMIPTGLVFDIPEHHSVRLHARSGNAFKKGLTLANCEGIIDSDYVEEVMCMMHNISDMNIAINNGDRLCQGELVEDLTYTIKEAKNRPKTKTDRTGGFGSTGE